MAEAAEKQGTPTLPARRWLRRTATLLVTLPLLGAALPGAATALPHAPAAPTAPSAAAAGGARIALHEVTPALPDKGDTITLSGSVTNNSRTAITKAHVGLRVGPALSSRSALVQAAQRTGQPSQADAAELDRPTVPISRLGPGASHTFTLKVPVRRLGLDGSGVYQLGVSLSGQTTARPYEQVLGIERTFLPWQTSKNAKKTRLTFLWPLISTPHLTARTESDEIQTPIFRDNELAEAIAPGGRLQQMVALGKDLPVTWVIDPDLLASVEAMTDEYEVRTPDGRTVPGTSRELADQWLTSLAEAVRGKEIIALPFADPDLASLAHHGRKVPGVLGRLSEATERASETVETILHTRPSTDFAWPVEGAVDRHVVDVATAAGAHHVLARSDSLSEYGRLPYTPTAARPIGGGTTAIVADHQLSTAFQSDLSRAGSATRAVQGFLAHTLSVSQQVPNTQRSLVVAPQRQPTASQARAMAHALGAVSESGRWTESADLSDAAAAKPDPAANRRLPSPGAYPDRLRAQELPVEAFKQAKSVQATLKDFAEVLRRGDRIGTPVGTAINREFSTAWRGSRTDATEYRNSVESYLMGLTRKVQLVEKSDLTLSGRSATIPVTVRNNLAQGIDGLTLKLTSSRRIGLRVEDDMQPVVVDGGHSQSVKFSTTAKANGRATVTAQLYTAEGKPYGPPMTFQVKVTSITSTVLLVIAGGVLLVVLAGIRMYTQRKRRGPAPDPDAPLDTSQEQHTDRTGSGHTEDEGERTAPPGRGPEPTGEKVDR